MLLNFPLPRLLWNAAPGRCSSLRVKELEKRRKQRRRKLGQEDPGRNSKLRFLRVQVSLQPTLPIPSRLVEQTATESGDLCPGSSASKAPELEGPPPSNRPGSTTLHDAWTQVEEAPGSGGEAAHCAGHALWPACPLLSLVHSTWRGTSSWIPSPLIPSARHSRTGPGGAIVWDVPATGHSGPQVGGSHLHRLWGRENMSKCRVGSDHIF